MTKIRTIFLSLFALAISHAQTLITPTTLSAAVSDSKTTVLQVASATGISGPALPSTPQTAATLTDLYIDHELMEVRGVSGTNIVVRRGAGGTVGVAHKSGALVFFGVPSSFVARPLQTELQGACTRGTAPADVLPKINVLTGVISDCLGGTWVNGVANALQPYKQQFPPTGGTAYTALNSSGTTLVAGTTYCTEVNLPANRLLTGIGVLAGTTVGTDKWLTVLYDSAGNALANSALAPGSSNNGSTASIYIALAFTAKYFAVGPAQYFACAQSNGTTDTIRMVVTGVSDQLLTKSFTGTFGTIGALTAPTTFTTAVGPWLELY